MQTLYPINKSLLKMKSLVTLILIILIFCLSEVGFATPAMDNNSLPADPTGIGPYGISHMIIHNVIISDHMTNVSIWYPTNAVSGAPADYTTSFYSNAFFRMPSPLGAFENATPAPGIFPLLIFGHGSSHIDRDTGRIVNMPMNEFLASHGFISVGFTYGSTTQFGPTVQQTVLQTEALINYIIGVSAISAHVDANKIGLVGLSLGGRLFGVAAGNPDMQRDPRIKVIIGYEATNGSGSVYYGDTRNIRAAALLIHDGYISVGSFNQVSGKPVIDVYSKRIVHMSLSTVACLATKTNRDIAISNGVIEPLQDPQRDQFGILAYGLWHAGDPSIGQNSGGTSDYCDVSEWTPSVAVGLLTGRDKITQEAEVDRRLRLYTLSFLKTYLSGQSGYESYLTEEYANENFDNNDLTVAVRN
jgi:hypothetical protein